ncbi:Hypothetical protein NTJ_13455 [Nesidiocoris tenuis]|uniref:Uncharacterized protein n=1 Tax=Nesidiocoris tenuis TaxID=355587 RepID=A0ABN7B8N3_9HEMI|nr:Hypothetical protein NTJ_13455 [Nesidiocoris tenuis]
MSEFPSTEFQADKKKEKMKLSNFFHSKFGSKGQNLVPLGWWTRVSGWTLVTRGRPVTCCPAVAVRDELSDPRGAIYVSTSSPLVAESRAGDELSAYVPLRKGPAGRRTRGPGRRIGLARPGSDRFSRRVRVPWGGTGWTTQVHPARFRVQPPARAALAADVLLLRQGPALSVTWSSSSLGHWSVLTTPTDHLPLTTSHWTLADPLDTFDYVQQLVD